MRVNLVIIVIFAIAATLFIPSSVFAQADPTDIIAVDAETDGVNGFTELDGPFDVATFTVSNTIYAIVVSQTDDGVQIINLSDPTDITAVDAETDGANGFTVLNNPIGVATFTVSNTHMLLLQVLVTMAFK